MNIYGDDAPTLCTGFSIKAEIHVRQRGPTLNGQCGN